MQTAASSQSVVSAQYAVPQRFGMAGILAITTLMAVLFGLLRSFNSHPVAYIFLGLLALVTCLVQMRYGDVPRMASIIAGAIFMPVCMVGAALVRMFFDDGGRNEVGWMICSAPLFTGVGAAFGYLAGACTAGLFLLMDLIEPHLPGGSSGRLRYARRDPPRPPRPEPVMAELVHKTDDDVIQALLAENPFAPTWRPAETNATQEPGNG
jgi:hypothetical protein